MRKILTFYQNHKIAAFITLLWLAFIAYITFDGITTNHYVGAEAAAGVFAGIVMFVPGALVVAVVCAIISCIFGTFGGIIKTNSSDAIEEDPIIPNYNNNVNISETTCIESAEENFEFPIYDTMEGHDFEYYCADLLKKNGFCNVDVTRGSGDQGIDILAEKGGVKYGIQCKCYSKDIGNKAVQEAFAGKTFYHCHVAAVLTNRFFTPSAKQLAQVNQVLLWDRNQLEKFIENAN